MLLELGDLFPVGGAGVALRGSSGVQRDRGRAFGFGDPARIQVGVVVVVDADAEFHGDRDIGALGRADGRGDDLAEQPSA